MIIVAAIVIVVSVISCYCFCVKKKQKESCYDEGNDGNEGKGGTDTVMCYVGTGTSVRI